VLDEIRETWASIWLFRTYEERSYYKPEHSGVTMARVHHSFPADGPAAGNTGWYAVDVEFKFDGATDSTAPQDAVPQIKQARPHPGRGE
jgi:hypothetical protein